jgi:nicotinamidase-related amidase
MLRARQTGTAALFAVAVALAATMISPASAQVPVPNELAAPDPAAIVLDASTTTFLAIDFLQPGCAQNPLCVTTVPAVAASLAAARSANAHVVYSVHAAPDNVILADIAPMPDDPIFTAAPGDKFFRSDLEDTLKQSGTTTLVLSGVLSNSGVMYTAAGAIQRGYTVVVVLDGIAGTTELATSVAVWQMLHGLGANPQNVPLQARSVTLSRTDLISYR